MGKKKEVSAQSSLRFRGFGGPLRSAHATGLSGASDCALPHGKSEVFGAIAPMPPTAGLEPQGPELAASPRLFENWLLDKLSRTHHLVPLVVYLPVMMTLLWLGCLFLQWPEVVAAGLAGYVVWTLLEYFGHRFVFHLEMQDPLGARIHFLIHGVHHDYPNDPLRLVMPLLMSAPIIIIAAVTLRFVCGPHLALPVLGGFIAGYVCYDAVHYHLHHGRPRTALGRAFRRRHMLHHFRDSATWFGVSAPWWDAVFGTMPEGQTN
jgi:dihydroceramide fatty acyl 2-hydroxylase